MRDGLPVASAEVDLDFGLEVLGFETAEIDLLIGGPVEEDDEAFDELLRLVDKRFCIDTTESGVNPWLARNVAFTAPTLAPVTTRTRSRTQSRHSRQSRPRPQAHHPIEN